MAGAIYEFFGYRAEDGSDAALAAAATYHCPFLDEICEKRLSDGIVSGVCSVKPITSAPVICCPIRLYAEHYKILTEVATEVWGAGIKIKPGREARAEAINSKHRIVAAFGKRWGGELRLPKKDGFGNYFVDWILALLNEHGQLVEFVAIEVQTVDTTGNYRNGRLELEQENRELIKTSVGINWENVSKRIIPQLIYKGQVLQRESTAKHGLYFVCPKPVLDRIMRRLGGKKMLPEYPAQNGSLTFLAYDYHATGTVRDGEPLPLAVVERIGTTVERLQRAFNDVTLQDSDVYRSAIEIALTN